MAFGPATPDASRRWYHRSPVRYRCRSAWAAARPSRNGWSAASSSSRSRPTAPSRPTGSRPVGSHSSGSTASKTSWVSGCHDQRRLPASSVSDASAGGRTGRTVNRRKARTVRTLPRDSWNDQKNGPNRRCEPADPRSRIARCRPDATAYRGSGSRVVEFSCDPDSPRVRGGGGALAAPPRPLARLEFMVGRIPVMEVMPVVDLGRQPAKATVGEPLPVRATVFREGHDRLGAEVVLIDPQGRRRPPVRMSKY